jgi:hypothetical protein
LCSVLYIHQNKHLFIQSTGRSPGLLTRLVPKISRGPLNEGRILYNALPHVIRNKKDDFHNYVKNYLMDNCFYSVEEFLNCKCFWFLILYIQFGLSYVKPDQTDNKHLLLLLLLLLFE